MTEKRQPIFMNDVSFLGLLRRLVSKAPRNDAKRENFFSRFPFPFSFRLGFTLAEILITLAIIGIVAALTIPSLINFAQEQQFVSGLLKEYSVISDAVGQWAAENNCEDIGICLVGDCSNFKGIESKLKIAGAYYDSTGLDGNGNAIALSDVSWLPTDSFNINGGIAQRQGGVN